jgi:hypothetical protein
MNQDHLLKCTVLNTENTPSIAKLYLDARRWMEFLQVPEHYYYYYCFGNVVSLNELLDSTAR